MIQTEIEALVESLLLEDVQDIQSLDSKHLYCHQIEFSFYIDVLTLFIPDAKKCITEFRPSGANEALSVL